MRSMSDLSLAEWNRLREQALSPADAVARLYADFPARTFAETLGSLCAEPDLRDALTRIVEGEGASPASADRTVRNWLGGKSVPDDREMLYALAFGLRLSVEGANRLLCAVSDYGIHARDPAEVVYLFALGAGMPFAEAKALRRRCEAMRGESEGPRVATRLLQGQVARLRTGEEFVRWYQDHLDEFSTLHGAAYGYFTEYLNVLLGGGEDFSLEYVADTCLRFQDAVPLQRSLRHMDAMQRLLRRYWPSATTVKQMKNRRIDVSRKTLLLLYIISEGETDLTRYTEWDEAYHTPAERLASHVTAVDAMLTDCGMGTLDPRGPFDWLVMYCMAHEADDGMSERMERVMACFFAPENASTRD